ncbi:MAG: ammonium transporter [Roseimicrobium sp.]
MNLRQNPFGRLMPQLRATLLLTSCVLFLAGSTVATQAQDALESELKQLQQRQQQELLDMQRKIEAQKTVLPSDPNFLRKKVTELEAKLKATETPLAGSKMDRPAVQKHVDYVWILISGVMVFFMQAGFAMLEMGSSRAKNSINCAMKGLLDFSSSSISYLLFGFTLMFGPSSGGFIGSHSFWLSDFPASSPLWVFWFFQVVFCGAACTIASGAMAERTKFMGYMAYTAFFSGLVYPVFGHWAWGSASTGYEANFGGGTGWLEALGFVDFAGSTVVHGIGGACALAGIMVVGPRVGRFDADGTPRVMPGHNVPLAFLGTFILFMAWFCFNAGSTLTGGPEIGRIAVNTCIAGSSGGFFGLILIWLLRGAPDAASTMNGLLAGCVAITAPCACVTPFSALLIGIIAGVLCSLATIFMERVKLDDVVGAVPVHLVCGLWGTMAVGIFHESGFNFSRLGIQAFGSAIIIGGAFVIAYVVFRVIDVTIGLRATDMEQEVGLDFAEHASNAYPDFKTAER